MFSSCGISMSWRSSRDCEMFFPDRSQKIFFGIEQFWNVRIFNHNMHVDATLKGNIAQFGVGRLSDQSYGGLVATPSMMYSSSSTGRSVIFPMVLNKVGELRHLQLQQKRAP